jgi:NADP-dependent aldehyde dehydrogenase
VIVKGHPAHPGTGELAARAVLAARDALGLAPGVFSYLPGRSDDLGAALVADSRIKAVAFTGSRQGGLALSRIAQARPEPIPVFAEMSAINPVILLPGALEARAEALGGAFVASLTMGAGQFCTNPGLVIALAGPGLDRFIAAASAALSGCEPAPMLTASIHQAYARGVGSLEAHEKIVRLAAGKPAAGPTCEPAALFATDAASFIADRALQDEVFGASSLVVRCRDLQELTAVIASLEGQLTATFHAGEGDRETASRLLPLLAEKAGRVLADGWPTGVEVCHAMVHGGPFPACSDGRVTSVGTLAMQRFLRPVCFQSIPPDLLPPALRDDNPWNVPRTLSGVRETKP